MLSIAIIETKLFRFAGYSTRILFFKILKFPEILHNRANECIIEMTLVAT